MWALYRTARIVGVACLLLTAYLCFAFYNFEGDVEKLRERHMTHAGRFEEKPSVNIIDLKKPVNTNQHNAIAGDIPQGQQNARAASRAEPIVPGNLLAPHLLHLRVEFTVKSSLLPSIVFENLHDPHEVENLLRSYEDELRHVAQEKEISDKWKIAESWVQPQVGIVPNRGSGVSLGDVLDEIKTAQIITADVAKKGTQLKLLLTLEGGQQVLFKPMFYPRTHVIDSGPFDGSDRHNGEIAAFHLAALLGMQRTPIVAGRRISLDEIRRKSTPTLNATFYNEDGRICFYGKCYYCKKENGVCADHSGVLEGAAVLMLPPKFRLQSHRSPWQRTYREGVHARWETDMNYCKKVRFVPEFSGRRIFDLMDNAVVDFLIGNADRHHVETFQGVKGSPVLLIDNGKSFGNPDVDEFSVLAPLYQCCLLRNQTYHRLAMFVGKLGASLERVTRRDLLYPLLTQNHLDAIDRRLKLVLATLLYCKKHSSLEIVG